MKRWQVGLVGAGLALAGAVQAEVRLPAVFSDHMVLQRERPIPVWGWAEPGEAVKVSLNNQSVETTAGKDGKWEVALPAMTHGGPYTLEVTGKGNSLARQDVLVGEVWLASGQSNMQWGLNPTENWEAEAAAANIPQLRVMFTPLVAAAVPADDVAGGWQVCTPAAAPGFSAVGFFFGRKLQKELGVPVGVITSSWGGTRIEPWISPAGYRKVPALKSLADWVDAKIPGTAAYREAVNKVQAQQASWLATIEECIRNEQPLPAPPAYPAELLPINTDGHPTDPTETYNAMIFPYEPYGLRGAIWYQGESNLGDGMLYADKMEALLTGWRDSFRNPAMPLYFVQLAPFNYGEASEPALPEIWEAQEAFTAREPAAHMAVISDIGDLADIHPRKKKEVGERLAAQALHYEYGRDGALVDAARVTDFQIRDGAVVLTFDQELHTADGAAPNWFEVVDAVGIFHPAQAKLEGKTVTVTSDAAARPVAVRYAWNRLAEPNLRNGAGLPVNAFRKGEIPAQVTLKDVLGVVEGGADYRTVFRYSREKGAPTGDRDIVYEEDHSAELTAPVKRVAYFWRVVGHDGKEQYLWASFDSPAAEAGKLGVPVHTRNAFFQQPVTNLEILTNMRGVEIGRFADGNIEFWDCNYGPENDAQVPGATDSHYDAGDRMDRNATPGYGSMQLHNREKGQTVFAYNSWRAGSGCDLGFGNCSAGPHPDWTFSGAGNNYREVELVVLARMK